MNDQAHTDQQWQHACSAGIFHAIFRLIAIADLYGPERAIEWAQSLVDDQELLSAFAHAPARPIAEITVRRLSEAGVPPAPSGRAPDFPSWN